jgi:biopolymer transport protein ExbD
MAGGTGYHEEDAGSGMIAAINVTPLVDITLVLLIIFMVTTTMIVEKDRGISIERPKTASGEEVKTQLVVTIDDQRVLHIDGKPQTDLRAAQALIQRAADANPELKAVIAADVNVPHGDVMRAIDMVKSAGVTKFALASDPLSAEGKGAEE